MPLEGKDGWGSSAPEISGVFVDVGDVGVFSLDLSVNSEASDECNISDRRFEARKKHFETKQDDMMTWHNIWDHIHQSITLARPPLLTRSKVSGTEPWGAQIGKFFRFLSKSRLFGLRPIWKCQPGPRLSCRAVELITLQLVMCSGEKA